MRNSLLCVFLFATLAHAAPVKLKTNSLPTPMGIDTTKPTFSWMSDTTTPNWRQSAFQFN
jgi:hypothetical protein